MIDEFLTVGSVAVWVRRRPYTLAETVVILVSFVYLATVD